MSIVRRVTSSVVALLVLLLATTGSGLGVAIWLRSWHGEYVRAAADIQFAGSAELRGLVDGLGSRAEVMTVVIGVLAAITLALGVAIIVLLRRSIGQQLRAAISRIGSSATQLLAVASQVAAGTVETAGATNESMATVEEVKQTVMLAQETTAEASELSQDLSRRCERGSASATQNAGQFERIREDMDVVAEAIDRLNEQTQSVGEIMAAVNDLAEQSNLLSVNASIEAAKAGEHGKGFAVVAQEVKSLAEQSKQAVEHVRATLGEIQNARRVAVLAVEQSRGAVEAGRLEAGHAIENTAAELEIASRAAQANLQISAASRQQLAGMEQLSQAMRSISEAGAQAASGTRLVEEEVRELQELALSLQSLMTARSGAAMGRVQSRPAPA